MSSRYFEGLRNSNLVMGAVFGLLIAALLGEAVDYGFVVDDFYVIRSLQDFSFFDGTDDFWRPVYVLWLSLQYEAFGYDPPPFHVVSLALHWLNACLAYSTLLALGIRRSLAAATVCLWILLAGNAYAVVLVSHCTDLLALFFVLLATRLAALYFRGDCRSYALWIGASVAWLVSLLSKEVAILWPLLAVAAAWVQPAANREGARPGRRVAIVGLPLLALSGYFGLRLYTKGVAAVFWTGSSVEVNPFFFLVRIVRYGEGLVNNLIPLDIFRSWPGIFLGGLVTVGLILFALLQGERLLRSDRRILVGCLCWIAVLSVHAAIRPAPRTLQISTLGLALLTCLLLARIEFGRSVRGRVGLVLLTLYLGMHIFLGKSIMKQYDPDGYNALASSATLVRSGNSAGDRFGPETDEELAAARRAYLERELAYVDVDALSEPPYRYERGPWRRLMRR